MRLDWLDGQDWVRYCDRQKEMGHVGSLGISEGLEYESP